MRELMKARLKCDVRGSEGVLAAMRNAKNEEWKGVLRELEEMGMFSAEYKQPIPFYNRKIGIVTAPTGAAIRDIMNISRRRNPYVQLVLCPALVQGAGAAPSIVRAIQTLDALAAIPCARTQAPGYTHRP